jgi:hypothetical protein
MMHSAVNKLRMFAKHDSPDTCFESAFKFDRTTSNTECDDGSAATVVSTQP